VLRFPVWHHGHQARSRGEGHHHGGGAEDTRGVPAHRLRGGEQVTSVSHILRLPDLPAIANELRGRPFVIVEAAYLGDSVAGAELIAPLRRLGPELDTFAMTSPADLGRLHMDPVESTPAQGDGALLADFPGAAIDTLVSLVGPGADTPLASGEIRQLGGVLGRPVPVAERSPLSTPGFSCTATA
jgi:hypothetical protein